MTLLRIHSTSRQVTLSLFFIVWSLWIKLQSWPSAASFLGALIRVWSSWVTGVGSSLLYFTLIFCALHILHSTLERGFESQLPRCQCFGHSRIGLQYSFVCFRDCFAIQTRLKCPGRRRAWLSVQDCHLPGALGTQLVRMFFLWLRRIYQSF